MLNTTNCNVHPMLENLLEEMINVNADDLYAYTMSEELWQRFEWEAEIYEDNLHHDPYFDDDVDVNTGPQRYMMCKIRNHDCMWAGHCGSKEHPADEPRPLIRTIPPIPPVIDRSAMANNKQAVTSGRSLLLKTAIKQQQSVQLPQHQPAVVSPDSPPMSDDEESKTTTLQILQDVISACDIEDDSDLCEYFEEEEFLTESVDEAKAKTPVAPHYATDNDHSYHKDKNATMHLNIGLGIETPSDSEEEIDVVSVGDSRRTTVAGMTSTLPNNPTSTDRQQLQKTMATAISNKRLNSPGIKTILPFRKPTVDQSPAKRKAPEGRGIKRPRRSSSVGSPSKKRCTYNQSSDSDAEPSEKRSLHNNMERQRRVDLRNSFEELRARIPDLFKKERAAKVVILREAAAYCKSLRAIAKRLAREKEDLGERQNHLRSKLSHLRRAMAAAHR